MKNLKHIYKFKKFAIAVLVIFSMSAFTLNSKTDAATFSHPVKAATSTIPSSGRAITVNATAYTASCDGCSGKTVTGIDIKNNPNAKVIAVDPSVIPLGSKVYIKGYGEFTAADTGGAIKGNRIDVFIPSEQAALDFGRKKLTVTILNKK